MENVATDSGRHSKNSVSLCVYGNTGIMLLLAAYLFLIPGCMIIYDLSDPGLRTGEIPRLAFRWHRALSPHFERWARERVASGTAAKLSIEDISGTEWPIFSSVFYLWATEALQDAWAENLNVGPAPATYARNSIQAAGTLVADPGHAAWVKKHWGDDYLQRENIFYRMLLISGLTSYQKLLHDGKYENLLRMQVESLSAEIDRSPHGLLDDYPGQCYLIDVLPAIAAIKRADQVLGTDHSAFKDRALRGFDGPMIDAKTGLPTYTADPINGHGLGPARGVGVSYMVIWANELWPETGEDWFAKYERQFWQETWMLAGFRELSKDLKGREWAFDDVDAGPIAAGYGTAASAFGLGAARSAGRSRQAYPLAAEALVASWPLPDSTLLTPRLLSNMSDAPYVGEAALLFNFTRTPLRKPNLTQDARLPGIVYLALFLYLGIGSVFAGLSISTALRWRKQPAEISKPGVQVTIWVIVVAAAVISLVFVGLGPALVFALVAQLLPRR